MEDLRKLEKRFFGENTTKREGLDWLIECWYTDFEKERRDVDGQFHHDQLLRYIFLKGYYFDKR